ncbi:hypothetical protein D3C71_1464130 [compost metagenome]
MGSFCRTRVMAAGTLMREGRGPTRLMKAMAMAMLSQPSVTATQTAAVIAAPARMARAYRLCGLSASAALRNRNEPARAINPAASPAYRLIHRLPGHKNWSPMPKNCSEKPALPSTTSA